MTDYVKLVDYAAKDALLSGNPAKLVKGTEIGAEFDAVATAVATKYDSSDLGVTIQPFNAELLDTTDIGVLVQPFNAALLDTTDIGVLVQPFNAALLETTDIGVLVQPFSTALLDTTDIGVLVQPFNAALLDTTDIGVLVQAYDVDTAKLDVDQTFTGSQRGTMTTDNDGSFDMNASNNFSCTPTGSFTFQFTNETSGQSGYIYLANGSNYACTLGSEVKAPTGTATALSVTGNYVISYLCYDGTNVAVTYAAVV